MNLCGITFYRTSANGARKIAKFKPPGRGRGEYSGIITRHKKERRRRLNTGGGVPAAGFHSLTGTIKDRTPEQVRPMTDDLDS